jgi:hypothetical protein
MAEAQAARLQAMTKIYEREAARIMEAFERHLQQRSIFCSQDCGKEHSTQVLMDEQHKTNNNKKENGRGARRTGAGCGGRESSDNESKISKTSGKNYGRNTAKT